MFMRVSHTQDLTMHGHTLLSPLANRYHAKRIRMLLFYGLLLVKPGAPTPSHQPAVIGSIDNREVALCERNKFAVDAIDFEGDSVCIWFGQT
jgi:hypothetical protein